LTKGNKTQCSKENLLSKRKIVGIKHFNGNSGKLKQKHTEFVRKPKIEKAILHSNQAKFSSVTSQPPYRFPLAQDFGFKGTTTSANSVLSGVYESHFPLPQVEAELLNALTMPESIKRLRALCKTLSMEMYVNFWKKAKEATSA
jgi:hypothetical protein